MRCALLLQLCLIAAAQSLGLSSWAAAQGSGGGPPKKQSSQAAAQPSAPPFFKFSGLLFGDVYGIPSHHLENADGRFAAWVRRIYVTGDFNFTRELSVRVRGEINQDGDFVSNGFTIDFKDLFVRWTFRRHKFIFGLAPSPTFDIQDTVWGYRHLERTPLDLQGVPSRDWGFSAQGPINSSASIRYRFMIGTGNDLGKETGEGQKLMGAVSFGREERGLLVDVYADFQELPQKTDRSTLSLFAHYKLDGIRFGGLYGYQYRQDDPRLVLGSGYVVADIAPSWSLVGRVDRLFAPSPEGDSIKYLPFDSTAKATLVMAGLEWRLWKYFSLTPNFQTIFYDRNDEGDQPKTDIFARLTFYLHY